MNSDKTHIYLISGLGANEKAFEFLDFQAHPTTYIPWLTPTDENESIEHYASRMAQFIKHENPILCGLSFGGMICMEIAKLISTEKIILFSTSKGRNELPPYFKWFAKTRALEMLNAKTLLWPKRFIIYTLGARSKKDREVVRSFLERADADYISWAVKTILKWENDSCPENCFHIHGSADYVLPSRYVHADAIVPKGRHLMIRDRSADVNAILKTIL